jgi:hydrogenase maturation protein HypF
MSDDRARTSPASFSSSQSDRPPNGVAYRLTLTGLVQGIGYRPELARLATRFKLGGTVANTADGIVVEICGPRDATERFIALCTTICPPEGVVQSLRVEVSEQGFDPEFSIVAAAQQGPLFTVVPLDRVTCSACLFESVDPVDRRSGYWLNSCSRCGPRYSILDTMPYERPQTTMCDYSFCSECRTEYRSPSDRRFHAQTIGCPQCGPTLSGVDLAIEALRTEQVIAVKGVGGYQLLARADSPLALQQLRSIKQRPAKPLAVMVRDLAQAKKFGQVHEIAAMALASWSGPIVIIPLVAADSAATHWISPGLNSIGVMLPTTALHAALVQAAGPLVVTSANVEGDPLLFEDEAASHWIRQHGLVQLTHDRAIRRPVDDSVVHVVAERVVTIRAARGLAPYSLELGSMPNGRHVLAVGGEQKVAIALCNGHQAILGPHLGDMSSIAARERFDQQVRQLLDLYQCQPTLIVHDTHPDYFTNRWAHEFSESHQTTKLPVQHHVAHVASSLIEPGWIAREVAAVTWDGTGLGTDHSIWGGEGFAYRQASYHRVCRLRRFPLPGGVAAIRQPWRIAAGLLHLLRRSDPAITFQIDQPFSLAPVLDAQAPGPTTSSMGRLFDAAAVLILSDQLPDWEIAYEGQFAALLESHADDRADGAYALPLSRPASKHLQLPTEPHLPNLEWNWEPLIRQIIADRLQAVPSAIMAMRFHRALATGITDFAQAIGLHCLTISGGVFQNRLLIELVAERLQDSDIELALPGKIPVNDGGLAAGQLLVALQHSSGLDAL